MANALQSVLEERSAWAVGRKFHAALRNLTVLGFTSAGSILSDVRDLVTQSVADAYYEGLRQGGVEKEEAEDEDVRAIENFTAEQLGFVPDFVKAVYAARKDRAQQHDLLDRRLELWTQSIETAAQMGLASASANEMVEWTYGDTDHCDTCAKLNGQKHRRKWFSSRGYFPRQPGCEALDCRGYNCQCSLNPVK